MSLRPIGAEAFFRNDIPGVTMENDETKRIFLQSPLFENIPRRERIEIAQRVQTEIVPADTIVFRQGDPGDNFYIIYSGKARVFRKDRDGEKTELAVLGPGDSIGETALLTGEPRSAYLETIEETCLVVLSKVQFDRVLAKYPNVIKIIVKNMSDKLKIERKARRQLKLPKTSWFDYMVIFFLALLFCLIFNHENPNKISIIPHFLSDDPIPGVDISTAMEKYGEGEALFVDARPNLFFKRGHIKDAVNIPLNIFDIVYAMNLKNIDKTKEIIVYGRTVSRLYDKRVADKLMLRGHKNVMLLEGGLSGWKREGFPVVP